MGISSYCPASAGSLSWSFYKGNGAGVLWALDAERGTDETGGSYIRRFTRLSGPIHPTAAPQLAQDEPDVMFQRIIYDGLVGEAFLRRFAVTFDVERAELVLSPSD